MCYMGRLHGAEEPTGVKGMKIRKIDAGLYVLEMAAKNMAAEFNALVEAR